MPVPNRPSAPPTTAADAIEPQSVSRAISQLAPRWRTWILQTLAQHEQGMASGKLAAALPFMHSGPQHYAVTGLTRAGLIDRPANPDRLNARLYRITDAGRMALPVHEAIADWARRHVCPGEALPMAEAAEIGFAQIMGVNTVETLAAVRAAGVASAPDLAALRPDTTRAEYSARIQIAYQLGLLDRVDRGRYELSPAARDLEPVLARLAEFAAHGTTTPATPTARSAAHSAAEAQDAAPRTTGSTRAAAASAVPTRATPPRSVPASAAKAPGPRQAPAVPQVAFSHPVGPFGTGTGPAAGRGRW